ncbi:MAG: ATP-binding protein [Gammaproteobacteria bacterium]|nr:ATP-binding protein [Gammaproteobacteria bacterium]
MDRHRFLERIETLFRSHPAVGILGPRQCGKTTLARDYLKTSGRRWVHYFDLEDPEDLARLDDARLTLSPLRGLVVIDEIQRRPELFPLLRVLVDRRAPSQRYLILGSASRELIRQSSESLAGRIAYVELPPFTSTETSPLQRLWLRGGFPRSWLARSNADSMNWRKAYIATFLERDVPALGIDMAPGAMRRLWLMLAHAHGHVLNASDLGRSMDTSQPTIRRYLDLLSGTFTMRALPPWHANIRKRQVKSPKVFFRDSGILHALLDLPDMAALRGHPAVGASWEGFALEQVTHIVGASTEESYFWRTHTGAELDLLIVRGRERLAFEFKYSSAPKATRSMYSALDDLGLDHLTIVCPVASTYALSSQITVTNLADLATRHGFSPESPRPLRGVGATR